ncbi:MAG: ferritin-like domain-containing protein [Coriobacteriia bacterium]|nr:ferritin-like domain-containing protein [Coriobacteriia bacterium]
MADHYADANLIDVLNDLRSRELAVIMQYMRQHYTVTGPEGMLHADTFKGVAVTEMKHAESLAERIEFLGGKATTKPEKFDSDFSGLKEMAKSDFSAESDAVMRYKAAVKIAEAHGDPTTRGLLESILADEEDHLKTFSDMLGGDTTGGELLDSKLAQ